MPRWNPIPSAICHEQSTDTENQPRDNRKTNGYIFKRDVDGPGSGTRHTRYIPKVCRAMPLYPRTYGLSCDLPNCQHCHPETAFKLANHYYRPSPPFRPNDRRHYYGYYYAPPPGTCLDGRKGCKPEKMIWIRPKKSQNASKDETRRRAARTEQAVEEEQDESKRDKTQRLSKWEASTSRPIDEGCDLALSEDIVLPTDDWKAMSWDMQLAILASQGLLDDYEAEDADITLNSLRRDGDTYTIRYKNDKRQSNTQRDFETKGTPILDDSTDWELVLGSQNEDSMSWIMLDE